MVPIVEVLDLQSVGLATSQSRVEEDVVEDEDALALPVVEGAGVLFLLLPDDVTHRGCEFRELAGCPILELLLLGLGVGVPDEVSRFLQSIIPDAVCLQGERHQTVERRVEVPLVDKAQRLPSLLRELLVDLNCC